MLLLNIKTSFTNSCSIHTNYNVCAYSIASFFGTYSYRYFMNATVSMVLMLLVILMLVLTTTITATTIRSPCSPLHVFKFLSYRLIRVAITVFREQASVCLLRVVFENYFWMFGEQISSSGVWRKYEMTSKLWNLNGFDLQKGNPKSCVKIFELWYNVKLSECSIYWYTVS